MWRTVLNTASGCTFMAEEQGSSACEGQGYSGCGRGGDMGQHCGKTVTLLKKKLEWIWWTRLVQVRRDILQRVSRTRS